MATYVITQFVLYIDGGLVDQRSIGDPVTLSNRLEGGQFTIGDDLFDFADSSSPFGSFAGVAVVGGSTFVIVSATEDGREFQYLVNTGSSSRDDFPAFFDGLSVDTSPFTVCFLAGTMIATPAGETAIEALAIGDRVLTADGHAAPVRWVGVQTVVSLFADRLRTFPVRITAGALGQNLPVRDLLVSPDHALFLDGALVQAGALVNGTTIIREAAMPERFAYFHVELEDHALILAEGVPAETFLDTVTRRRFDNWADYEARYGDTGPVLTELPAPRVKSARQLPATLREQFAVRSGDPIDGRMSRSGEAGLKCRTASA